MKKEEIVGYAFGRDKWILDDDENIVSTIDEAIERAIKYLNDECHCTPKLDPKKATAHDLELHRIVIGKMVNDPHFDIEDGEWDFIEMPLDEIFAEKATTATPEEKPEEKLEEPIEYVPVEIPYYLYKNHFNGYKKGEYYPRSKSVDVLIDSRKVDEFRAKVEQLQAKDQEEKEAAAARREALTLRIKYKDYKEGKWAGKIDKQVYDSYRRADHTIAIIAKNEEAAQEMKDYYEGKAQRREEYLSKLPEEVRAYKEGLTDEYTHMPAVLNPDAIDDTVPEEIKNG